MIEIILMRHWEADGNLKKILMWCKNWSFLTEIWKEQSNKVWQYFKKHINIDLIFSSPVKRAKETSLLVNSHINTSILYFEDLREIDWWSITWLHINEIPKNISKGFQEDPFLYKHPEWESIKWFFDRISKFISNNITLNKYDNKTILIITHDNVIKWIISHMKWIWREAIWLKIDNASLTYYSFNWNDYLCNKFNYKVY